MALKRLDQLRDEMAFFFRAKAQAASPVVDNARIKIQHEHDTLAATIQRTQDNATTRLAVYRERFLEKLEPLLTTRCKGYAVSARDGNISTGQHCEQSFNAMARLKARPLVAYMI